MSAEACQFSTVMSEVKVTICEGVVTVQDISTDGPLWFAIARIAGALVTAGIIIDWMRIR